MKKKIARILTTFALVLCVCFGLTACKKDDNKDDSSSSAAAKVTSIAVELTNDSYELTDGTITKTYGEAYNLTSSDFKIVATFDDETTQTLPLKTDTVDGYTFTSSVKTTGENSDMKGDLVQAGDYTLSFGYGDLTVKTITYKVEKATFDTSVLTWTSEMKYNSALQAPVITNENDYKDVVTVAYGSDNAQKAVSVDDSKYTATATLTLVDTRNYVALTTEQTTLEHEWTMQKGDHPTWPAIQFASRTYNATEQTAELLNIDGNIYKVDIDSPGSQQTTKAKNAGTYPVKITLTYKGVGDTEEAKTLDKNSYNEINHTTEDYSWTIDKLTIQTNNLLLTLGSTNFYSDASFIYSGSESRVYFYLGNIITNTSDSFSDILSYTEAGTTATNAGTYTARITFTVKEAYSNNYDVSDATVEKQWKINKANFGVFAKESQKFVYGKTQAEISTSAELAEESAYNDVFVDAESFESRSAIYKALKNAITSYEIRLDTYNGTTAYTGKLNAGTYYLYPIIPSSLTFENYDINSNGTSFTITKKELDGSIVNHNIEYNATYEYVLTDLVSLTGFVNNETKESVITSYAFKFRPSTSTSDSDWTSEKPTAIGEYSVKFEANVQNYSFEKVNTGLLTITKANVQLSSENISWNINNDNTIIPTYNETDEKWSATFEKNESAITYSLVINSKYGDIFNITHTDENGETLESITSAGEYTIKATVALKADTSVAELYNEFSATFILEITINENYFETNTASGSEGEPEKTISVVVETTEEDAETGVEQGVKEDLTFNEFASKTEFKEGDTVKFTLKDDPAAISSSAPSEEGKEEDESNSASPASRVVAYATETKTFVGYKVLYNGQQVAYDITEGSYVITLTSSGAGGLVIQRLYKEADSSDEDEPVAVEIFIKSNFKVRVPKPTVSKLESMKIGETTYTSNNGNYYYKLAENQTEIVVEIDAEYVGKGYYVKLQGDSNDYEFSTSNIVRIPVSSFISSTDLVLSLNYGNETTVQARVINWVEIKTVDVTYINLTQSKENIYHEMCLGKTLIGAIGMSSNTPNYIITNIAITFEDGYGAAEGWSYTVTEEDGTTVDYTKTIEYGKDRIFVVNVYKDNVFKYKLRYRYSTDFHYSNSGNTTTSVDTNYDYYVKDSTLSSIALPNENKDVTSITQKFKKSGTSEYDSSVTLDSDLTSVDWKLEIVAGGKTYTFTKTLVVVKENATYNHSWLETEGNLQSLSIKYGNDDNVDCEINEKGLIRINSNSITLDNFKTLYYDKTADDKGASNWELTIGSTKATKSEYLIMGGFVFLKFTVGGNYIILKLDINGLYDNVVDAEFEIMDSTDFSITKVTTTMQDGEEILEIPTGVELEIYLGNDNASVILTDSNGEEDTSDYFIFTTPGTYTLVITSVDETNTRTIKIIVTGEEIPMLKIEVEAEQGDDKVYVYDVDTSEALAETGDFKIAFDSEHNSYKFYAYAGKDHGLKITTEGSGDNVKRYVTLKDLKTMAFSADTLHDVNGNQITIGNSGVKLEILTDINGNSYFAFYGIMSQGEESMPYYVYVYLCDYIASLELEFDSGSTTDTKLTLDYINFSNDSAVTEDSELEVREFESSYCLVAFLGATDHGLKIYEDTELGKYISLKSIISGSYLFDGVWSLDEDTGNPTKITSYPIKLTLEPIAEGSELLGAYFYTNMFTDGIFEKVIVYLFFCDESDLPDDFFESDEPEHVIPDGGSGDNSGDGSGDGSGPHENSTGYIMKVTMATTNDEYIILVYNNIDNGYGVEEHNNVENGAALFESETGKIAFSFDYVVSSSKYNELMNAETYILSGLEFLNQYASATWTLKTDTDGEGTTISSENSNLSLKVTKNYEYDQTNGNPCLSFVLTSSTGMKIICNITFVTSSGSVVE